MRQIAAQILGGALPPGAFLPAETELGQQFGVSRTVIREAARVLAAKGLVAVKHGSGMQVQPAEAWDHLDPVILFEQVRLTQDDHVLDELLELRRAIEAEAAALAAQRRTPEAVRELGATIERMRALLDDPDAYTRLDIELHDAILAVAGNRLLQKALQPVSQVLIVGRLISSRRPGGPAASQHGHEAIVTAIEQGDADGARAAMRAHIVQFEDDVRTSLREGFVEGVLEQT